MRSAHATAARGPAVDIAGSVHANAASGHAHPVGEGCSDIFVTWSAILAAIASMDASALVVSGAEDGGAFGDHFFHWTHVHRG